MLLSTARFQTVTQFHFSKTTTSPHVYIITLVPHAYDCMHTCPRQCCRCNVTDTQQHVTNISGDWSGPGNKHETDKITCSTTSPQFPSTRKDRQCPSKDIPWGDGLQAFPPASSHLSFCTMYVQTVKQWGQSMGMRFLSFMFL